MEKIEMINEDLVNIALHKLSPEDKDKDFLTLFEYDSATLRKRFNKITNGGDTIFEVTQEKLPDPSLPEGYISTKSVRRLAVTEFIDDAVLMYNKAFNINLNMDKINIQIPVIPVTKPKYNAISKEMVADAANTITDLYTEKTPYINKSLRMVTNIEGVFYEVFKDETIIATSMNVEDALSIYNDIEEDVIKATQKLKEAISDYKALKEAVEKDLKLLKEAQDHLFSLIQ